MICVQQRIKGDNLQRVLAEAGSVVSSGLSPFTSGLSGLSSLNFIFSNWSCTSGIPEGVNQPDC